MDHDFFFGDKKEMEVHLPIFYAVDDAGGISSTIFILLLINKLIVVLSFFFSFETMTQTREKSPPLHDADCSKQKTKLVQILVILVIQNQKKSF
jgi:hypothetical protein